MIEIEKFYKMIIVNEIQKVRARVGAMMIDCTEKNLINLVKNLDEANKHLQNAIDEIEKC